MIDRIRFNENFSFLDKEVVVEIIDIFLAEYEQRLVNIKQSIDANDFTGFKFNAHSMKGVVANFMDPVTIELSKKLDEKAKNQDSSGLEELFNQFKKSCFDLVIELQKFRQEFSA